MKQALVTIDVATATTATGDHVSLAIPAWMAIISR
jgi:hypothetical protein